MQKISLGNKEYVKASQAAKRFKYTQDYIGQLCRGDKIDARLVGRVWYVNLDSITEYRKTKHATQKNQANTVSKTTHPAKTRRLSVEPVVRPKTARRLQADVPAQARLAVRHVTPTYSRDKSAIIPVLHSDTQVKKVEAKTKKEASPVIIKVRTNSAKSTRYHAEKLPDITLKSKLKVTDEIADLVPKTAVSVIKKVAVAGENKSVTTTSTVEKTTAKAAINFHPNSVTAPTHKSPINFAGETKSNRSLGIRWASRILYFLTLVGVTLFILGIAYFDETGSPTATSGFIFSIDFAIEKLSILLN